MTIDIILATYNGEKFLKEQINSILNQTYKNIRLFIRDDGSSDLTKDIILEASYNDKRIIFIEDSITPNGVGENFKQLLKYCTSNYVFISDQDDVWNINKIEVLLNYAKINFNDDLPCIAYSSAFVVDLHLNNLNKLTSYKSKIKNLNDMILMNGGIQGCSMVINKKLYDMALEKDFFWYMHDQVLTLYAISFGSIHFCNASLFSYRQHENNVLGFNNNNIISRTRKYLKIKNNNFFINKKTDDLFIKFLSLEKNELDPKLASLLYEYKSSRKRKLHFLIFLLKNQIKIRNSILKSLIKLILIRNIIEH